MMILIDITILLLFIYLIFAEEIDAFLAWLFSRKKREVDKETMDIIAHYEAELKEQEREFEQAAEQERKDNENRD